MLQYMTLDFVQLYLFSHLIAGRAEYFGNLIPGKVIKFWKGMFFPLFGKEVRNQTFEVLVTDNPSIFRWVPASSGSL